MPEYEGVMGTNVDVGVKVGDGVTLAVDVGEGVLNAIVVIGKLVHEDKNKMDKTHMPLIKRQFENFMMLRPSNRVNGVF